MVTSLTGAVSVARAPTASEICLPAADQEDVVPLLQHRSASWHERLPAPHDADDEAVVGQPHVAERAAHGLRALVQDYLGHLDGVLGEAVYVDRARHQQRFLDLQRRHLLRVDYEVDPKHLPGERLSRLVVVGVVYTRHGAGDALGLRRQARDDVHFV